MNLENFKPTEEKENLFDQRRKLGKELFDLLQEKQFKGSFPVSFSGEEAGMPGISFSGEAMVRDSEKDNFKIVTFEKLVGTMSREQAIRYLSEGNLNPEPESRYDLLISNWGVEIGKEGIVVESNYNKGNIAIAERLEGENFGGVVNYENSFSEPSEFPALKSEDFLPLITKKIKERFKESENSSS